MSSVWHRAVSVLSTPWSRRPDAACSGGRRWLQPPPGGTHCWVAAALVFDSFCMIAAAIFHCDQSCDTHTRPLSITLVPVRHLQHFNNPKTHEKTKNASQPRRRPNIPKNSRTLTDNVTSEPPFRSSSPYRRRRVQIMGKKYYD